MSAVLAVDFCRKRGGEWGNNSAGRSSGGAEENGYDAHGEHGKFAVYPGDNFETLTESFAAASGISKNEEYIGASTQTAAIMPYYTISMDQDPDGQNVGNGFSEYIVSDLLRGEYNYSGLVMTDWMITGSDTSDSMPYTSWGVEAFKGYDVAYRYYKIISAGVDQFGGVMDYDALCAGYETHLGSVVLLKNSDSVLPLAEEGLTASRAQSIGYDWLHADGSYLQFDETPDESRGDYKSNRSILGTTSDDHSSRLSALYETIELMDGKPVVVILNMTAPTVVAEFEPQIDALVVGSGVADQAMLEVISGRREPSGLLSVTLPPDMDSVDASYEDLPDTTPYVDTDGNVYEFGFGLDWNGIIEDERTEQYKK